MAHFFHYVKAEIQIRKVTATCFFFSLEESSKEKFLFPFELIILH